MFSFDYDTFSYVTFCSAYVKSWYSRPEKIRL